jgi:phycocyanobilin lyase subunit alpha
MDELVQGELLSIGQAIDNLVSPDTGLRFYAAWWLGRFKVTDDLGVVRLIAALADADDRTEDGGYPLRRNAARALGKIGDMRALEPLIGAMDCADFYVREAAAQSLEMLGDDRAVPVLVKYLQHGLTAEGELISSQPDLAEPYDAILEALGTIDGLSRGAYPAPNSTHTPIADLIRPFLGHPVGRTQYAADRAMYQLTGDAQYGNLLIEALRGNDLQLRRAALSDVGAIGYLPAAEAIAETLAENSLKLIALKGVLAKQVEGTQPGDATTPLGLSDGAVRVMALMDGLL